MNPASQYAKLGILRRIRDEFELLQDEVIYSQSQLAEVNLQIRRHKIGTEIISSGELNILFQLEKKLVDRISALENQMFVLALQQGTYDQVRNEIRIIEDTF